MVRKGGEIEQRNSSRVTRLFVLVRVPTYAGYRAFDAIKKSKAWGGKEKKKKRKKKGCDD